MVEIFSAFFVAFFHEFFIAIFVILAFGPACFSIDKKSISEYYRSWE